MQPWHSTERVLFFQGPSRPAGMANLNSLGPSIRDRNNRKAHQFKELHQKLSKESFVLQTRYDVSKDTQMGASAVPMDLNNTAGILRWTDFPDPPHNRPPHLTSRGKVEIWDQPGLMTVMMDNQYTYVRFQSLFGRHINQYPVSRMKPSRRCTDSTKAISSSVCTVNSSFAQSKITSPWRPEPLHHHHQ